MWLLKEIYCHRREHYLNILATSVAVFLLLTVSIMCDSADAAITSRISDLGLDVTMLQVTDAVDESWIKEFRKKFDIADFSEFRSVNYGFLQLVNCDSNLYDLFDFRMKKGCFIDYLDTLYNANKAVLGYRSYLELGCPDLGETVSLEGVNFTVCGILDQYSDNLFIDLDNSVLILSDYDLTQIPGSVCYYFRNEGHFIDDFIEDTLGKDNYVLINQTGMSSALDDISSAIRIILTVIADVSVVVAFVGLINSTLSSIGKRSFEIGIKKSLGASDRDIYLQFVSETLMILVVSVFISVTVIALVIMLLRSAVTVTVNTSSCIRVILRVMIAGFVCSLYPAFKASRCTVIGSIRAVS